MQLEFVSVCHSPSELHLTKHFFPLLRNISFHCCCLTNTVV